MANLSEETKWENGIYQLEIDDPLQGGADGIDNVQAKQLANRTRYLKEKIESTQAKVAPVEASEKSAHAYAIGEQFMYNDILYTASAEIAVGDTITPGTNCSASDELVKALAENGQIATQRRSLPEQPPISEHGGQQQGDQSDETYLLQV